MSLGWRERGEQSDDGNNENGIDCDHGGDSAGVGGVGRRERAVSPVLLQFLRASPLYGPKLSIFMFPM